jgi:D-galactarolactone isomerase
MKESVQVPYSTGRNVPKIDIPELTCDTHCHIFDPVRFPYKPTDTRNQPPATVDVYRLLQRRLGMSRCVVVTPSAYGYDNSCTMDAVNQMGDNARAVVVLKKSVTVDEIATLHERGARGVRYNIVSGSQDAMSEIVEMADKVAGFGWHMVFWMSADLIAEYESVLRELPCKLVFDHRGHLPASQGINHKAFRIITSMMQEGKAYVKLSALYHDSAREDYSDTVAVGRAYVQAAPDQVLWGSDWPHHSEFVARKVMPDDAYMLDLLADEVPDENMRYKILVDNPARLYGFDA